MLTSYQKPTVLGDTVSSMERSFKTDSTVVHVVGMLFPYRRKASQSQTTDSTNHVSFSAAPSNNIDMRY